MRPQHTRIRRTAAGSVLVIAMLIMGAGTFGLAAWTSLVVARSTVVDATIAGMDRRVTLQNSRQFAREWMFREMVGETAGAATTETTSDGWASFSAPAFSVSYLGTYTDAPYNRTGPMPYGSYGASIDVLVSDGQGQNTGRFFVDSGHPSLSGDLLVVHNPPAGNSALAVTGDLRVKGRALLMTSANLNHEFKATRVSFPITAGTIPTTSDLTGNTLLPDNLPFTPLTTGKVGGVPNWGGQLNVVNNPDNTENSYYHKVSAGTHTVIDGSVPQGDPTSTIYVPADGSGLAQITIGSINLENIIVSQNVTNLVILGQATASDIASAETQAPVTIVILDPSIGAISFEEENYRPMVLAIKNTTFAHNIAMTFTATVGFPYWKMIMELEGVRCNATVAGTASQMTLLGGIRTDTGFNVGVGSAPIILDEDSAPGTLNESLCRQGWIESFVQPGT